MTISLRLSDADALLIRKYAELNHMSVSDLIRQTVMERIEDEIDLKVYESAMAAYQADSTTYSHDEVKRLLALE